jgi:hypothetical protein
MQLDELKIKYLSGFENAVHRTKDEFEKQLRLMTDMKMFDRRVMI